MVLAVFLFSSRRRHTRYIGDWSSDVCSSDLVLGGALGEAIRRAGGVDVRALIAQALQMGDECHNRNRAASALRSEERRVGKECRYRRMRKFYNNNIDRCDSRRDLVRKLVVRR